MSKQNESIPEAPGTHQPCPEQTHRIQMEENDQGPTADAPETLSPTEAPAVIAEGKTEDREDMDPPRHSIFDAGTNKMSTASSVGGDRMHVDSSQASSGERVTGGITKDPRPATVPKAKKPGAVLAGVASAAAPLTSSPKSPRGDMKKDPRPATVHREKKHGAFLAGVASVAASSVGAQRTKDPRPVPRSEAIAAVVDSTGAADTQRRKDPRPTGSSCGVASQGTAAARERQKDPRPTSSSGGTASVDQAASSIRRKDPRPAPSPTPVVPEPFNDEPIPSRDSTDDQASQTTPGAFDVPGINSDNVAIDNADPEPEQPGTSTASDIALNVEATANSQHATLQATISAYVVNERGQEAVTTRNTQADELSMEHMFAGAPLVSGDAVQNVSAIPDANVTSHKCSPREYSRRSWAMLVSLMAIIVAAATLMGVLIPRGSTASSQEGIQGSQSSAAPSSIPSNFPSHLPSLSPTDPDTLRLNSIRSILVPISGPEVLLDTSTPQYRALEWVSLNDTLQLPYNTEAERKRVVQRYILAVLYYASGGQHWSKSHHFLEGIHECNWWSYLEHIDSMDNVLGVGADGALCTQGVEVGVVDHLKLVYNNITGSLPAELQHLTDLESLEIRDNYNLIGPIPGSIGNMTSLTHLDLSRNKHTGTIPSSLGRLSNLEELWLYYNRLTGTIPESFGSLTSLRHLSLGSNMLNGTIPSVLGQLSSLWFLELDGNRLTGEIPIEICRRAESGSFILSPLTAIGTEFLCECIPVEDILGCCVARPNAVGDGSCEVHERYRYNTAACGWDGGDCLLEGLTECLGINPFRIGNGLCDVNEPYNTGACGYDGGDCCESTCEGRYCGYYGYDCKDPTVNITCLGADGLEGCCVEYPSQIGDGYCHPYEPHYTEACKYDNGDCPATCPEGTSPVAGKNMSACCVGCPSCVGDGLCYNFEPYNTAACGWDGGDCCEETCEGWGCGWNEYVSQSVNSCKDPSISN